VGSGFLNIPQPDVRKSKLHRHNRRLNSMDNIAFSPSPIVAFYNASTAITG
jgi:hypothetical protein